MNDLYIFPLIFITCDNIYDKLTSMDETNIISLFSNVRLWVQSRSWWSVLDTILCDIICQWLATSLWFPPGTPVSSTNKTDTHNISEILINVALNTITLTLLWHNNDITDYYQILDKPTIVDRFYSKWIFIASSISCFVFDAISLWEIYSHKTNQQYYTCICIFISKGFVICVGFMITN